VAIWRISAIVSAAIGGRTPLSCRTAMPAKGDGAAAGGTAQGMG
jgi:hypothetical protein